MAYGDAISSPLPTPNSTADSTAVAQLKDWADEVEARLETAVTEAGITIGGALEMNDNELTECDAVAFDNNTATKEGAGNARRIYVKDDELYYTNSLGTTVRITTAGAIDVSSTGGITGDYSSDSDADADYVTANLRYRFFSNDGNSARAEVEAAQMRLAGTGNNPTLFATIDVPALAASYSMTLPANDPVSGTELLQWDSNGDMSSTLNPSVSTLVTNTLQVENVGATWGDDTILTHFQKKTFTPTITTNVTAQTVTSSIGRMVQVGDLVLVYISATWEQSGTETTKKLEIGGLPTTLDDGAPGGVGDGQVLSVISDGYADNPNDNAAAVWVRASGRFDLKEDPTSGLTAFWDFTDAVEYEITFSGILYDVAS